ncbi:MAG: hypothetical protein V4556_09685 [Bacteroidota bacterium]
MPEELQNEEQIHTHRPLFLSLLCILAFLASVIGIIQNANGYFKADEAVNNIQSGNSKTQLKNLFSMFSSSHEATQNTPVSIHNLNIENYQKFSLGGVLASILCVIGTILMWKLQKNGFYAFALGTFFNIITHFLLFGDNISAMGLSIIAALGGLIFVILFGLQLKNMD